jgi:hypothetical protein
MIAGDSDNDDKFAGVVVTPDNFIAGNKKRAPWRWGAVKDRRKLKGTNQ